jgi:hypothetical protein
MSTLIKKDSGNERADEGHLFVCCACGKTSTTRYGFERIEGRDVSTASPGWDESCMLNASEFAIDRLVGNEDKTRVVSVGPKAGVA